MRPQASSGPAGPRVRRQFESHRLAGDFQARAYEQVVPLEDPSDPATSDQAEGAVVEIETLRAKGVAA
jgi:hypothetical protein